MYEANELVFNAYQFTTLQIISVALYTLMKMAFPLIIFDTDCCAILDVAFPWISAETNVSLTGSTTPRIILIC